MKQLFQDANGRFRGTSRTVSYAGCRSSDDKRIPDSRPGMLTWVSIAIAFFMLWNTGYFGTANTSMSSMSGFTALRDLDPFRAVPDRSWTMYNKPWKTGSSSRSYQLSSCLIENHGYRVVGFNWTDGSDVINPVSPTLHFSRWQKMFSGNHGRFNLGELQSLKTSGDFATCYVTSIRDPATRIPSHMLQLADGGNNVVDKEYQKDAADVSRLVCSAAERMPFSYMAHYMAGLHTKRALNMGKYETDFIAQEVFRTYDIIVDEAGTVLYDSGRSECTNTRECLNTASRSLNVKIGDKGIEYPCKEAIQGLVDDEKLFYDEILRLIAMHQ